MIWHELESFGDTRQFVQYKSTTFLALLPSTIVKIGQVRLRQGFFSSSWH